MVFYEIIQSNIGQNPHFYIFLSKSENSIKPSRGAQKLSWFSDFSQIFQYILIVWSCPADDFTSEMMPWICFYEDTKPQKLIKSRVARKQRCAWEVFPNFPAFHEFFGIFWHRDRIQRMIVHRKWCFGYGFSSKQSLNSKKCRDFRNDPDLPTLRLENGYCDETVWLNY